MHKQELTNIYYKALNKVKAKSIITDNVSVKDNFLHIGTQQYNMAKKGVYLFGVGKAALDMANECENLLKEKVNGGVVISNSIGVLKYCTHFTSTHPLTTSKSIEAANLLTQKITSLTENDLFIFLLSGGASAMIEKPIKGLTLDDFSKIASALLTSGIDIKALNTVRKSISAIKGGKLADQIKAKGEVLVLSDVIGDDLNTIGSAPMNNNKFNHHLVGNNNIALNEALNYIKPKVEFAEILTITLDLNAENATTYISNQIKTHHHKYNSYCLLIGGETTTIVKGKGKGGRNQELALRLLLADCIDKNTAILSAGSDGIDGNSDATGAFLDHNIYEKIKTKKLNPNEYLENSDSNTFFKQLGYDFVTGISGTNVMDFIIILKTK